ncbi:MAG: phage major capsid protein [Bacteroides xylanisolvens]
MAKEKSTTDLKDERSGLVKRGKELIDSAKKESRAFTDVEQKEYNEIQMDIRSIDMDIREKEIENRGQFTPHNQPSTEKFSLRRAILSQVNKVEQRESEASVIDAASEFHRSAGFSATNGMIIPLEARTAYTAGTESPKRVVIDEEQQELLLPLESNLVLSQAGVRLMTGLVGDISWPKHSAVNVYWEGENAPAKDGGGEFKKGDVFKPNRLTAIVDISKQLLIQENRSIEGIIRALLGEAVAQKVEQTAFSADAAAANVPNGLFQGVDNSLGAINWENVVKMETDADLKNALFGNLAYILHPALIGKAKTKVKDASGAGGFVFGNDGNGMLNGYRAFRTNNLPKELGASADEYGSVFANWAHYFLGQWGALDIVTDPFTQAGNAMVRIIVNSYWNMGKIREESFSTASMK